MFLFYTHTIFFPSEKFFLRKEKNIQPERLFIGKLSELFPLKEKLLIHKTKVIYIWFLFQTLTNYENLQWEEKLLVGIVLR